MSEVELVSAVAEWNLGQCKGTLSSLGKSQHSVCSRVGAALVGRLRKSRDPCRPILSQGSHSSFLELPSPHP